MTLQLAYATSQLGDPAEALSTYEVTAHGQTRLRITASKVCRQWKPAPDDLAGQLPVDCLACQVLTTHS